MVNIDVLAKHGLTNERLKKICTAKITPEDQAAVTKPRFTEGYTESPSLPPSDIQQPGDGFSEAQSLPEGKVSDGRLRLWLEQRIRFRIDEAIERSLRDYKRWAATDLALDTSIVSGMQLPLEMLAQGHIDLSRCRDQIKELSAEWESCLFKCDGNGEPVSVNVPRFWEISHNLVASLLTRRVAAVATPIVQRVPMLKYDSRSTALTGKLRADMMSQRAEIMVDDFDYRHAIVQSVRDVSAYTHQVEFLRSAWEKETQILRVPKKRDDLTGAGPEDSDFEEKEVIIKEGVDFIAPHPSRVFWDRAYPLAKLNSDTGPRYCGYWDLVRKGELYTDDTYWNKEAVTYDSGVIEQLASNREYYELYLKDRIAVPASNSLTVSMGNDRVASFGEYAEGSDDFPVTLGYYFEKLNPKTWGIADYDHDVWFRFTVAGNSTIIHAEILGSSPAVVYHYNENDSRDFTASFAMAVMPYQTQVSNLLTQLLETQYQGLMKMYALNTDGMAAADVQAVEDAIHNRKWYAAKNIIIKYSAEKLRDTGINPQSQYAERLKAIEISTTEKTSELIRSIVQVLSMAERLLFFSPQELGQVAPREISATEASIVNNTTLGIRDFHSVGIEEGLDAKKRIIYESTMAFGSDEIELPVLSTYSREVIEAAGFKVVAVDRAGDVDTAKTGQFTVSGDKHDLIHNYIFTSRDGTERAPTGATAQAAVQLLDVVGKYPALGQTVQMGDAVEMINDVARSAGLSLRLQVPNGVDPASPMMGDPNGEMKNALQQLGQVVQQLAQAQQQAQSDVQALAQSVSQLANSIVRGQPTRQGQIAPDMPMGSGAPPMQTEQPAAVGF